MNSKISGLKVQVDQAEAYLEEAEEDLELRCRWPSKAVFRPQDHSGPVQDRQNDQLIRGRENSLQNSSTTETPRRK